MSGETGRLHEALSRQGDLAGPSDRRFGVTIAVALALFGVLSLWRGGRYGPYWLGSGAIVLALALVRPALLHLPNRIWLRLGLVLNAIMSPIILGMMFALVFVPTGFLMRLCGKDPLRLKRDAAAQSYWIERSPPGPAPDSLKHQY